MCTYLWPDNGDMRPSFRFLGYVHLYYPSLLKSEHFSYGRTLICQTYSLPLNCNCKGQRPHKGTENTMKITITAIHIKETLLKRKLKTKLLPQCFQRITYLCWIISTRNYFVRTHIHLFLHDVGLNQREGPAGKAVKVWCLPRFWVSICSYKKQPVKKKLG